MPRTIESIVNCHAVAAERRAAGRPIWDAKANIKQFLDPDAEPSEVAANVARELRHAFARRLRATSDNYDCDLDMLLDDLENFGDATVEDFDETLDRIYDWADENRIWLG